MYICTQVSTAKLRLTHAKLRLNYAKLLSIAEKLLKKITYIKTETKTKPDRHSRHKSNDIRERTFNRVLYAA